MLGLSLIGQDEQLREAIRQQLAAAGREGRQDRRRSRQAVPDALAALIEEPRKLLRLHYADQIDAEHRYQVPVGIIVERRLRNPKLEQSAEQR